MGCTGADSVAGSSGTIGGGVGVIVIVIEFGVVFFKNFLFLFGKLPGPPSERSTLARACTWPGGEGRKSIRLQPSIT